MGVYVCKHADVVSLAPLSASDTGHILVFKVVKVQLCDNFQSCLKMLNVVMKKNVSIIIETYYFN